MQDINVDRPPPFTLYVVWHPDFTRGYNIGNFLLDRFGSHRYRYVSGGDSVRVIFRNVAGPGSLEPLPIDWNSAGTTAVVVLLDSTLVGDPAWVHYVHNLAEQAERTGFGTRLIPVAIEDGVLRIGLVEQALRWHDWTGPVDEKERQLVRELTDTFIRMLRYHLARLRHPGDGHNALDDYLTNVRVFLSHSKHDGHGEIVADALRTWLNDNAKAAPFLDVRNIPAGVPFDSVLEHEAARSVMVAIYTDSYSSRDWCRREVITAKRRRVPMLVVDCLQDNDASSFPYLGNVPWVRMNPQNVDRLDYVTEHLLEEVFKDFLWQCRVESFRNAFPGTTFLARAPELMSLTSISPASSGTGGDIVYPGPPISLQEKQLFVDVAPNIRLYSLNEWLAEVKK